MDPTTACWFLHCCSVCGLSRRGCHTSYHKILVEDFLYVRFLTRGSWCIGRFAPGSISTTSPLFTIGTNWATVLSCLVWFSLAEIFVCSRIRYHFCCGCSLATSADFAWRLISLSSVRVHNRSLILCASLDHLATLTVNKSFISVAMGEPLGLYTGPTASIFLIHNLLCHLQVQIRPACFLIINIATVVLIQQVTISKLLILFWGQTGHRLLSGRMWAWNVLETGSKAWHRRLFLHFLLETVLPGCFQFADPSPCWTRLLAVTTAECVRVYIQVILLVMVLLVVMRVLLVKMLVVVVMAVLILAMLVRRHGRVDL